MSTESQLWYFAYGANLDRETLIERRGIVPTEAECAVLRGYELTFDQPGIPLMEPSFANLKPCASAEVHGVAYRLTALQLAELDVLEGGGAYDHLDVQVEVSEGRVLEAKTYATRDIKEGLFPSRRYLALLVRGARQHGLPEAWIARLEGQRTGDLPGSAWIAPVVMRGFELLFRARSVLSRWTQG